MVAIHLRFARALAPAAALALACSVLSPAVAVTMFRWVDERGVTHIADSVPQAYRAKATQVESATFDVPDATRREAVRRAAVIASAAAPKPAPPSSAASGAAAGVSRGTAVAPPLPDDDCATLQRRYDESFRCFDAAPKVVGGGVNPARTPGCVAAVDPSRRCGLPKADPEWRRP